MKQIIYDILTSPKIQTNGVILNNCIDYVSLCFDRLLLQDLSAVQVLHNICYAEKVTKHSSLLLLRLVTFSA